MPDKKTIAVVGATGAQGGGLVRAIMADADSEFTARAITRNVDSPKAQELAALGAEVVAADIDDVESLEAAFDGAYGAFCVTFLDDQNPEKEKEHATNMATAARNARLHHVVWSTLEDTRRWIPLEDDRMPTLVDRYKVPHFDVKGESDRVFADLGVPTTNLLTSFYWDNLIYFGMEPKEGEDGVLTFALPMGNAKLPGIAAEDIGRSAYAIFKKGTELIGRTVGIAGEHLTGQQMAEALTRAYGREVRYFAVPPEVFRGLGFPLAEDLGNMFQFKQEFEDVFCGHRDLEFARSLNPAMQTFEQWLGENYDRIPKG